MAAKKYFATVSVRCGLKKTFQPGEEINCEPALGDSLVADGHATTDLKLAGRLQAEEEKRAEDRKAALEDTQEMDRGEKEEAPKPKASQAKRVAVQTKAKKGK